MKIIISIGLSLLFLFQGIAVNMEICEEIEKITDLVVHYQEHKSIDGDSVLDFIYEDYIADDSKTDSHHQDSENDKMPVHSGHQCCQHSVFFTQFTTSIISFTPKDGPKQFDSYTFQLNSRYLESPFQPPKV